MALSELSAVTSRVRTGNGRVIALFELTKPKISVMVLVSIVVSGVVSAEAAPNLWDLLHVAVGMFLVAASGNAMNMYLERYSDYLMPRTAKRPLPDRRLTAREVAVFGAVTAGCGFAYLLMTVNWLAAVCAAATWILYVLVYTPLKRVTWLNTEVGAVAGALPVFAGSFATAAGLNWNAWSLFLVLLFWQFPHFMAIAWLYRDEYRNGGMKMLTVVDPTGRRAGRKAVWTSVVTWAVSLLPLTQIENAGAVIAFIVLASIAGAFYSYASWRFQKSIDDSAARKLLRVSVVYLPIYMLLLVLFNQ